MVFVLSDAIEEDFQVFRGRYFVSIRLQSLHLIYVF